MSFWSPSKKQPNKLDTPKDCLAMSPELQHKQQPFHPRVTPSPPVRRHTSATCPPPFGGITQHEDHRTPHSQISRPRPPRHYISMEDRLRSTHPPATFADICANSGGVASPFCADSVAPCGAQGAHKGGARDAQMTHLGNFQGAREGDPWGGQRAQPEGPAQGRIPDLPHIG